MRNEDCFIQVKTEQTQLILSQPAFLCPVSLYGGFGNRESPS